MSQESYDQRRAAFGDGAPGYDQGDYDGPDKDELMDLAWRLAAALKQTRDAMRTLRGIAYNGDSMPNRAPLAAATAAEALASNVLDSARSMGVCR